MKTKAAHTQHHMVFPYKSLLIGLSVGTIIYVFKILSKYALDANTIIYQAIRENIVLLPLSIGAFLLISLIIDKVVWFEPNAGGSSISRTALMTKHHTTSRWYSVVILTLITTLIVFVIGVPLGIEGPSIMIGAGVSLVFMKHQKATFSEDNNAMVLSGIGAGFAAATGTIFASVIFVFEEIYHKTSRVRVMHTLIASITAFITIMLYDNLFNLDTIGFFKLPILTHITVNYFYVIPMIGVVAGLSAAFFNVIVKMTNRLFATYILHMPRYIRFFIILIIIFIVGLIYDDILGSGQYTILSPLFENQFTLRSLFIILVIKTILIALANAADIPGGMFVPVLVVGALYAALMNTILIYFHFPSTYTLFFTLIFMAAFFASSMKAPITAFVFFSEISLSLPFTIVLAPTLGISVLASYLLKTESINDIVIEKNEEIKLEDNIQYGIRVRIKGASCAIGKNLDVIFNDDIIVHGYVKSNMPHLSLLCQPNTVIDNNDILYISYNGKKDVLRKILDRNLHDYDFVYE
ncbi:MAG: chloride channel protein [Bacillota bacterium]